MIYVIPDIHGEHDKFLDLLDKVVKQGKKDSDDFKIVFLGDYIDRGNNSRDVVDLVYKMSKYVNVITLIGNHDHNFYYIMKNIPKLNPILIDWLASYCIETLESYDIDTEPLKVFKRNQKDYYNHYHEFFVNTLKDFKQSDDYGIFSNLMKNSKYFHKEGKYIFSHSGGRSDIKISEHDAEDWISSRDFKRRKNDYKYICGHTPTKSGEVEEINNILMCDVGATFKNIELPLIVLEEE